MYDQGLRMAFWLGQLQPPLLERLKMLQDAAMTAIINSKKMIWLNERFITGTKIVFSFRKAMTVSDEREF